MDDIAIRPAKDDDLGALAELRWRWLLEYDDGTAVGPRDDFVRQFVDWARTNAASHHCMVTARGDTIIGMAWLAIVPRVPTPHAPRRASGDVQSVYVVPEERNCGVGGRMVDAVVALAGRLGIERVTVHSSPRAISAYSRSGFATSPRLMQTRVASAPN